MEFVVDLTRTRLLAVADIECKSSHSYLKLHSPHCLFSNISRHNQLFWDRHSEAATLPRSATLVFGRTKRFSNAHNDVLSPFAPRFYNYGPIGPSRRDQMQHEVRCNLAVLPRFSPVASLSVKGTGHRKVATTMDGTSTAPISCRSESWTLDSPHSCQENTHCTTSHLGQSTCSHQCMSRQQTTTRAPSPLSKRDPCCRST
jgi:hypothetical protein